MRAKRTIRVPRAVQLLAAALVLAVPAATVVGDIAPAHAQNSTSTATTTSTSATATTARAGSRIVVRRRTRDSLVGQDVSLPGHLRNAGGFDKLALQRRDGKRWATVARARTGRHGGFDFHYRVSADRSEALRVRFAGNQVARPSSAPLGAVVGLVRDVASWYYDGGDTACGFHAGYGVANKTLPCGTRVTFVYDGRTVTATVDDRGPYVAGRSYDLSQTTAQALGMDGVATVETSL